MTLIKLIHKYKGNPVGANLQHTELHQTIWLTWRTNVPGNILLLSIVPEGAILIVYVIIVLFVIVIFVVGVDVIVVIVCLKINAVFAVFLSVMLSLLSFFCSMFGNSC